MKPIAIGTALLFCAFALLYAQHPPIAAGTISGRVDPGLNLLGVGLARYTYGEDGEIELINYQQVRTTNAVGRQGEYRFEKVEPGEYYVYVNPSSLLLSGAPKGQAFATTYYPGALDVRTALRVAVRNQPGENVVLREFKLASFAAAKPRIRLVDATGDSTGNRACATASWKMKGAPSTPGVSEPALVICGQDGVRPSIEIPSLPPGTYDVFAGWMDRPNNTVEGTLVSFELRDRDVEVEAIISRARLTGRIVLEDRDGTLCAASGIQFELRPKVVGPTEWGETIADGSLQHDRLGRNDYNIEFVNLPPDAYAARVIEGDRDVLSEGLKVGSTNLRIDALISLAGGTLEGTITASKGAKAQRAIVALVPAAGMKARHLFRTATTGADGTFTIRGIAPGPYQLFAWSKLNGTAYKNEEFMKAYAARGIPITIERNAKASIEAQILD